MWLSTMTGCEECDPYGAVESQDRLDALLEAQALLSLVFNLPMSDEDAVDFINMMQRLKDTVGKKYVKP